MTKKPNYYSQILTLLSDLQKSFPSYNLGKHLSTALDGQDVWGMSDKSLLYALTKYKTELELDMPHSSSSREIEYIIKGGLDLDSLLEEEED